MSTKRIYLTLFSVFLGTILITGCPPKKKLPIEDQVKEEEPGEGEETDETADGEESEKAVEISQDWTEIPALQNITFGYDAAKLTSEQRKILKQNVAILKKLPTSVSIRIGGHCDDRGTIEYNIALGQRRANAVRSYYKTAGISLKRLETISFGEERPLCTQQVDACWSRNRRAVTKVRNPEIIKVDFETFE